MTKQFAQKKIFLLLSIAAILGAIFYYSFPDAQARDHRNPGYPGSYSNWVNHQINPETILASLDSGDTNVFTPMLVTPDPDTQLFPVDSFSWTQSDYLKIANALSQYIWKEPLDLKGWNVYYLVFHRECQNNPSGFDWMELTYYKTTVVNWKNVYPTRHIEIYPLASEVITGSSSDFSSHYFKGNNRIDFTKFEITADDALQITEENGGEETRLRGEENGCLILIRTSIRMTTVGA